MRKFKDILQSADRRIIVVLIGATFVMALYLYQAHPTFFLKRFAPPVEQRSEWWDWYKYLWEFGVMFLLWVVVPMVAMRKLLGCSPRNQGIRLGDWRFGLKALAVVTPLLIPVFWLNALNPQFQAEYPLTKLAGLSVGTFVLWELCRVVYYVAWEYFFRGYMLFGLERRLGAFTAIAIQTMASTIIHIGKPEGEMLAAIVAGVLFGVLAIRTRSILYPFILHWFAGFFTDLFCLLNAP